MAPRGIQAGDDDALWGLPGFDQWKPDQARQRADKPGQAIKYEAPPGCPDGGGLLLPRVPDRCWELICERQGLPFPDAAARADGFWAWAMATPALELLICEGFKKALAAVGAGWAAVATRPPIDLPPMISAREGRSPFSSCTSWRKASCNTAIRSGPWRRPVSRIRAM